MKHRKEGAMQRGRTARLAEHTATGSGCAENLDHRFGLVVEIAPEQFLKLEAGRTRPKSRISLPHISMQDRKL